LETSRLVSFVHLSVSFFLYTVHKSLSDKTTASFNFQFAKSDGGAIRFGQTRIIELNDPANSSPLDENGRWARVLDAWLAMYLES